MRILTRLALVFAALASACGAAYAQSSPPPNPNYTRFRQRADGDIPTPSAASVNLFFNGSTLRFKKSDGTFVDLSAGSGLSGSGTTGTLPKFASATTLGDSILSESSGAIAVGGSLVTTGRMALGSDATIGDPAYLGDATPTLTTLNIRRTESGLTALSPEKYLVGQNLILQADNASGYEAFELDGLLFHVQPADTDGAVYDYIYGISGTTKGGGTGSTLGMIGVYGSAVGEGDFTSDSLTALQGIAHVNVGALHDVTYATGASAQVFNYAAGRTIGGAYGIYTRITNAGTIDETYGIYIDDVTSGTQTAQAYALYSADANAPSHFAGYVETPAVRLLGSTSGYVAFNATGAITSYTVSWPTAVASANASPLLMSTGGALSYPTGTPDGSKFLRDDGAWALPSSGGLGADWVSITNADSPYTPSTADGVHYILVDASSGAVTINLPAVSSHANVFYRIKKTDSSANAVTLDGNSTETIDGSLTFSWSAQYAAYDLGTPGSTGWHIF